jgi:hypothetical protein
MGRKKEEEREKKTMNLVAALFATARLQRPSATPHGQRTHFARTNNILHSLKHQ